MANMSMEWKTYEQILENKGCQDFERNVSVKKDVTIYKLNLD